MVHTPRSENYYREGWKIMTNTNVEISDEGIFDSVDEARNVLRTLLKYFSKDSGDNESLKDYLLSKITVNEVGEKEPLSVKAEYRSANLVVNVPVDPNWTSDKVENKKLEVLVAFSSMLDESKTKTLVQIYRSLRQKARLDINEKDKG